VRLPAIVLSSSFNGYISQFKKTKSDLVLGIGSENIVCGRQFHTLGIIYHVKHRFVYPYVLQLFSTQKSMFDG
jgi:hypothetical protein